MNFVIDIGNTRTKAAVFDKSELIDSANDEKKTAEILEKYDGNIQRCMISSVADIPKNLKKLCKLLKSKIVELDSSISLPFKNSYTTKNTLGKDRIAAVAGACALYPCRNVLIIDAGTAITLDVKTANEEYQGGNITPGLTMRFKALHDYTSNLPLLEHSDKFSLLGQNTTESINNGVQNGLIFELNSYLEIIRNKYDNLVVLLTGGDVHFFDNKLKNPIFVVSNLTLIGLNFILEHNANKR